MSEGWRALRCQNLTTSCTTIDLLRLAGDKQDRCVMLMWSGGLKVLEVKSVGTLGEAQANLMSEVADLIPTLEEWRQGIRIYPSST